MAVIQAKRGRPRIDGKNELRHIGVRLTAQQYAALDKHSTKTGKTYSQIVREMIEQHLPKSRQRRSQKT